MSLVNEMLNDLQKEKIKGGNFDGLVAVKNTDPAFLSSKMFFSLILIVLIMAMVWFVYLKPTAPLEQSKTQPSISLKKDDLNTTYQPTNNDQQKAISTNSAVASNLEEKLPTVTPIHNDKKVELTPAKTTLNEQATKKTSASSNKKLRENNPVQKTSESRKSGVAIANTLVKNNSNITTSNPLKKPMIRVSRKSLADKELHSITNVWNSKSLVENKNSLEKYLARFSDIDTAWLGAINWVKDKNFDYHQQLLNQALTKFPSQPAFRMIIVKQLLAQNDFSGALIEIKKIDSSYWQQSHYRIAGFLAQKVNDHLSAIKFYNHLLKSEPNQGDINMAVAISLEALNENSLAIAKFQRALEDASLKPIQRQFIAQRIAVLKG